MKINRKIIIYGVVSVLVFAIATAATIFIMSSNNKSSETKILDANKSVSSLRIEAEAARKINNTTRAKVLLSVAKQKLTEQPKSDANTNAKVDVNAQQCMLGVKSACKGY